jgi:Protein of unknown function (DUF1203)
MSFHIKGLSYDFFISLFSHDDAALGSMGVVRCVADANPGYPCRVSLEYAAVGEELLLLPFEHLPSRSPYRASGPIYVRRGVQRFDAVDVVPDVLQRARLLSLRGYDHEDMMVESDVVAPTAVITTIEAWFADQRVAYLHVHNARPGCFACRVDRA